MVGCKEVCQQVYQSPPPPDSPSRCVEPAWWQKDRQERGKDSWLAGQASLVSGPGFEVRHVVFVFLRLFLGFKRKQDVRFHMKGNKRRVVRLLVADLVSMAATLTAHLAAGHPPSPGLPKGFCPTLPVPSPPAQPKDHPKTHRKQF